MSIINDLEIKSEGDLIFDTETNKHIILKSDIKVEGTASKENIRSELEVQKADNRLNEISDMTLSNGDIFRYDGTKLEKSNINDLISQVEVIQTQTVQKLNNIVTFLNAIKSAFTFKDQDGNAINYTF